VRKPGLHLGMTSTVTNRLEGTVMAIKAVVFDIGGVLELIEDNDWPESLDGPMGVPHPRRREASIRRCSASGND
jgi:hypothetical protein